jgi:hypothetical protein
MSKSYDIGDEAENDLTLKTCTRVHAQTIMHGIHYGNCDLVTVKGPCSCMAPFDAGIMIGSILRYNAESDVY